MLNFFKDYKTNTLTLYMGESKNLSQEIDLQKEARNIALKVSSFGYHSHLYEKTPNELNRFENKEYILYLQKNKFSLPVALLNMKSKFSNKIRKVNLPLINFEEIFSAGMKSRGHLINFKEICSASIKSQGNLINSVNWNGKKKI